MLHAGRGHQHRDVTRLASSVDSYSYVNTEVRDAASRMGPLSSARKLLMDNFVTAGKTHGWWTLLDILYIYANATQTAACQNWKSASFTAVPTGAGITFTADRGFQRTDVSSYVSCGGWSGSQGVNYTQNACGVYCYLNTDGVNTDNDWGNGTGAANAMRASLRSTSNNIFARIQTTGGTVSTSNTVASAIGFFAVERTGSGALNILLRKNKTNVGTGASGGATSTALTTAPMAFGKDGTTAAGNATGRQGCMFAAGANMSTAISDFFSDDLAVYLTAVGAI